MTAAHRPRDLDDAIQLIRGNQLTLDYRDALHEYVRTKYQQLWHAAQIDDNFCGLATG